MFAHAILHDASDGANNQNYLRSQRRQWVSCDHLLSRRSRVCRASDRSRIHILFRSKQESCICISSWNGNWIYETRNIPMGCFVVCFHLPESIPFDIGNGGNKQTTDPRVHGHQYNISISFNTIWYRNSDKHFTPSKPSQHRSAYWCQVQRKRNRKVYKQTVFDTREKR